MANENAINELLKLKNELSERIRQVDITIDMLKTMPISADSTSINKVTGNLTSVKPEGYESFDINASFRAKVIYVIKTEKKFLHAREIAQILNKIEPTKNTKDLIKKVSPILSLLKQKGVIIKIKVGRSNINSFWGGKDWVNENGLPKSGYEYDDSYLVKAGDNIDI